MTLLSQQVQQTDNAINNYFILFLYGAITLFFAFKIFKSKQAEKQAQGEIIRVKKSSNKILLLLIVFLVAFSIYSVFIKMYANAFVMLALLVAVICEQMTQHVFAENGFVADAKWINWDELKKWEFNRDNSEVVINYKKDFEEKTSFLKIDRKELEEVERIFRKYKLKKK